MPNIARTRHDPELHRDLYGLDASGPGDLPASFPWDSSHFACLIAWDTTEVDVEAISAWVDRLLDAGCVHFCCWGPDCERVHDIIDETVVQREVIHGMPERHVVTTWHSDESLSEAIWYFLNCSHPNEPFEQTCRVGLGIAIACESWSVEMRAAFEDPLRAMQHECTPPDLDA